MIFRVLLASAVFAASFFGATPTASARQMEDMGIAVLRTIDKVSAVTRTFEVPVDKTVKFGTSLFIRLRACRKSSPMEQPENAAFLQIWERKPETEKSDWVFSGWMFASNPSLSAMDHPVYDVWVIECKNAATSSKPQDFTSEMAPEAPEKSAEDAPAKDEAAPEGEKPEISAPDPGGD